MNKNGKAWIAFGVLFFVAISGIVVSSGVQNSWGKVNVSIVEIPTSDGLIMKAKLYRPNTAVNSSPAPGVLAIHGYNNDKDVQRPHAIELSKRGIVVLAIDQINHGDSEWGDDDPQAALWYLANLSYVNPSKIGVTGHSMGAIATMSLATSNNWLEAIAPVAFSPGLIALYGGYTLRLGYNPDIDILHVASWGEEFARDWNETIEAYVERCLGYIGPFVGTPDPEFFHTYGNFTDGASRFVMLKSTHPGQTHRRNSTAEITAFFLQSLSDYTEEQAFDSITAKTTVYWVADLFGVLAMAGLLFSVVPLAFLFMSTRLFGVVEQPMPKYKESYAPKAWVWWLFGTINAGIGFVTYVFNTDYSFVPEGGTEDVASWVFDGTMLKNWFPHYFPSGIANDFESFFLVNAGIMMLLVTIWYFAIYRPKRVGFYELGASYVVPADELEGEQPNKWEVFGKTVLLTGILFLYMYGITAFSQLVFNVEIRGPWSGFKLMTEQRSLQFFPYFIGPLLFWIFNAGIWMFGMMRQKELKTEVGTVIVWWLKICVVMLTGLVLLNVLQYVPMYLGFTGPWINEWAVAPMDVLQLWSFIPFAAGFYLIAIIFFRKTGKIWLSSLLIPSITTWMMVTSYIMA
jgi:pimeloyl-ACP methyl ester carboxylesterase